MREQMDDLVALRQLLDRSAAGAGAHLASIFTTERRLTAEQLVERLVGMRLLTLATVTATGEPRTSPVDGIFYRGRFWFGSAANSARFRHIRARPAVSATHLPGESLAVVVHGRCELVDVTDDALAEFRDVCLGIYGAGWRDWGLTSQYARIDADRMYTFAMDPADHDDAATLEPSG